MSAIEHIAYFQGRQDEIPNQVLAHELVQSQDLSGIREIIFLAAIAAARADHNLTLFPYLLHHLETCRPKDVPQHAESILPAVSEENRDDFVGVLQGRIEDLSTAQAARVRKIIKAKGT